MSQNNTISGSARRSSSPELWIPYLLIGVSCVSFLAVHFWCYHKRNRERYLRKRDETRVKSGLLERRRITTLMLAKYQSDLGIIQKEKPVDLTRLFYDNSVDVIFDEYDYYRNINTNKHRAIHSSTALAKETEPSLPKTHAATDSETTSATLKAIASSQTWPLVTERKNTPYNAHIKSSIEDSTKTSAVGARSIDSCDTRQVIYTSATQDKQQDPIISALLMPPGEITAERGSVNNTQTLVAAQARSEHDNLDQTNALRLSSSPTASYPGIFYTSLTSPLSSQSSFLSVFTPKHKKLRCYCSPAKASCSDHMEANENIVSKPGEFPRLYDTDTECSVYLKCENISLENCPNPCSWQKESTPQSFSKDETLPFAEYGDIYYNSAGKGNQMMSFNDQSRINSHETGDRSVTKNSCCASQANPLYSLQIDNDGNVNGASKDADCASASSIDNTSSSHSYIYQQNIIIPFPEKSHLNIVSKNPGKTRSSARANDQTHVSLPRPRPGKATKRNTVDSNGDDIHTLHASNSRSHEVRLHQEESLPLFHLPDTHRTQNLTAGFSFGKDVPENVECCVDYISESDLNTPNNNDTVNTTQNKPVVCNTIPKTPTLRSLDKCIVFQNTKRKLGMHTE